MGANPALDVHPASATSLEPRSAIHKFQPCLRDSQNQVTWYLKKKLYKGTQFPYMYAWVILVRIEDLRTPCIDRRAFGVGCDARRPSALRLRLASRGSPAHTAVEPSHCPESLKKHSSTVQLQSTSDARGCRLSCQPEICGALRTTRPS